jgi:hypothetical protein
MAEISDLEPVDADNIARFPEGQLVPTFNNGARALEGILARWFADTNGTIVSTGDAPSYAVATSSTYISLVDGLVVVWRAHASFESGTAKLTINALTQKNLVRQNGTALVPGDIVEDQTVVSRYNSDMDAFECLGIMGTVGDAATQAEMETATSTTKAVTPGRQHYHPGHPKFWAFVTVSGGTPTLQTSYNVTSITDSGVGYLTTTIANDFSSANWCCMVSVERHTTGSSGNTDGLACSVRNGSLAAGSVGVEAYSFAGSSASDMVETDPASWHVVGLGDL